jgi:hypothetical protein
MAVSRTQIDRLGERLKGGPHTESDLRLLDDYRRSFGDAYEAVVRTIRQRGEFPTGRLAKSTVSIVEKLRRESIRLSQIQDIAGCRVIVGNVVDQEQFVASLTTDFPGLSVIDRRDNPSYGYRAVHIIAEISGKAIEIQVRTSLQHLWAEVSEKSSDVLDPTIKHGGGPGWWRDSLTKISEWVAAYEKLEKTLLTAYDKLEKTLLAAYDKLEKTLLAAYDKLEKTLVPELLEQDVPDHMVQEMLTREKEKMHGELAREKEEMHGKLAREKEEMHGKLAHEWNDIADRLNQMISWLDNLKGQNQ